MTLETVPRYDPDRATQRGGRAVVVGASMAGMLAARVLADHYDSVLLIDRDPLPDQPVARRGVPQAEHAHVMTEAARATLADLFPGYGESLISAGALIVDVMNELAFYDRGDYVTGGPRRIPMYTATRPLFEQVTRRKLATVDGIELRGETHQLGFLVDGDAVTGVRVQASSGTTTELSAELVVDATGRTSRTPRWLEANGFDAPGTDEVHVDLAYTTVQLERPPGARDTVFAFPSHPQRRGAGVFPVEGDRWILTFSGMCGDHPPTDPTDLEAFAADLPIPAFSRLLREQALAGDGPHHYPFPSATRHRYEALAEFPEGLLVVGDAVASFNPIYGQGMAVAALEALELHALLGEGRRTGLPARFFDRISPIIDDAWTLAVGADFQFPETSGPKPRGTDLLNRYVDRLTRTAHVDSTVAEAYVRVIMMERRPRSLFRPGILRRVLGPGR